MRITTLYDIKKNGEVIKNDIKMTEVEDIVGAEATSITGKFRACKSDDINYLGYDIHRKHFQTYFHKNGYKASLFGKSSMSIYDKDWKEVMHTGSRSCETEEQVMNVLENVPMMIEEMHG